MPAHKNDEYTFASKLAYIKLRLMHAIDAQIDYIMLDGHLVSVKLAKLTMRQEVSDA